MSKQILAIDDDRYAQLAYVYALKGCDYTVHTASSGEEALSTFQRQPIDFIFLDLKMPGMDGVETLRRLRQHNPDVPVYIATAYQHEFMQRLKEAAAEGLSFQVASKPLTDEQIRTVVRSFFEQPQLWRSGP